MPSKDLVATLIWFGWSGFGEELNIKVLIRGQEVLIKYFIVRDLKKEI